MDEIVEGKRCSRLALVGALLLGCAVQVGASTVVEEFDRDGSDPLSGLFERVIASRSLGLTSDGIYIREALSANAPQSTADLPVQSGGDKELRFHEDEFSFGDVYLLSGSAPAQSMDNSTIDSYIGFASTPPPTLSAGLVARVQGDEFAELAGYGASLSLSDSANSARLQLVKIQSGRVGSAGVLALSEPFQINQETQNLRLSFTLDGNALRASVSVVSESQGNIVETPVALGGLGPNPFILSATDDSFTSGSYGFRSFARGDDELFYDNFSIGPAQPIPLPPAFAMMFGGGALLALLRRRRGNPMAP